MGNFTINCVNKETGESSGVLRCEVCAYPFAEPKGKTKGFASIFINGVFAVHGISIIEGKNGLFAAMPQTRDGKGAYHAIFHPVTSGSRAALRDAVLAEYAAATAANGQTAPGTDNEPKAAKG